MSYVIFFDEKFLAEVRGEVGDFENLGDGVGLVAENGGRGKNYVMDKYIAFDDDVFNRLKHAIFVRHFYHVDCVLDNIDELDIEKLGIPKDKKVALHLLYSAGMPSCTQAILGKLEQCGYKNDIKNPDFVISITFAGKIYVGCCKRAALPTNYKAGMPHFAKRDEISRAEYKLQEVVERYNIDVRNIECALDLGASPGGWTHMLARNAKSVVAVDPAELDDRVSGLKNVLHYKEPSQSFLTHYDGMFDMVVNDMKMIGDKSAYIVCNCTKNIKAGAVLVMTIKLAEENIWEQIVAALEMLKPHFQIVGVKKLFHNRQEVTVVAKFVK